MTGFYGIGEVFVKVADLDRATAFYRDILGFEIVPRNNEQLYIHLDTAHLVLKKAGSPGHDAGGPMHFAFATSTEKINELVEKFASLDYRTRGPFDFEGPLSCHAFFVFDPDGNEVEFSDLYYRKYVPENE
ncbi:MAG: VOC family protein [Candidatus Poribacteria bacterium]|nr:VOC family protein [Candidatus Poribacteria bacterium]